MKYKILSILMSTIFIMINFTVHADVDKNVDSADSKVIKLLGALDIMQIDENTGMFWDETPVTRKEIARIICQMHGYILGKDTTPAFSDVQESDRVYIETAVRYGVLAGYSTGEFGPDDFVTNEQLVKIMVTSLGGEILAQRNGGYPSGYMAVGEKFKILSGNLNPNNQFARRIDVARMVYDVLHTEIMKIDKISENNIVYNTISGKTFLNEIMGIYIVNGVVEANGVTSLNRPTGCSEGCVMIGESLYEDKNKISDDYLGCAVNAYIRKQDDNGIGEVVHFEKRNFNKIIKVNGRDIVVENKNVKYYQNDKLREVKLETICDIVYNGKSVVFDIARLKNLNVADVIFIDNDGNGAVDVIIISEYVSRVVEKVNVEDEKIICSFGETTIGLKDREYKIYRDDIGIQLDDIKAGEIILVAISDNTVGKKVVNIDVSSEFINGTVTSVREKDGIVYVKIAGKEYEVSEYFNILEEKGNTSDLRSGLGAKFYIDARNRITYMEENTDKELAGYLIDYVINEDSWENYTLRVMLYNENKEIITLSAEKTVKIDGIKVKVSSILSDETLKSKLDTQGLVKYSANGEMLSNIIFPNESYCLKEFSLDAKGTYECNHNVVFDDKYALTSETKVFYIPNYNKSSSDYLSVMTDKGKLWILPNTWFKAGTTYSNISFYDVNEDGTVSYVLFKYGYNSKNPNLTGEAAPFLAVNNVVTYIDEGDNEAFKVLGYDQNGIEREIVLSDTSVLNAKQVVINNETGEKKYKYIAGTSNFDKRNVEAGDIIQYHSDNNGKVDDICIQHKSGETVYYKAVNTLPDLKYNRNRVIFGKVMHVGSDSILISSKPEEYTGPVSADKYIGNTGVAVYRFVEELNEFIPIYFDEIEVGNEAFAYVNVDNITKILVIYE